MPGVLKVKVGGTWVEVPMTGPPGPEGPPGPPPSVLEFNFAIPTLTWIINHNLANSGVEVNCYDPSGTRQFDPEIEITDSNTATVYWYYPTAGVARVLG